MSEQNTAQNPVSGVDMGFNLQVARRRRKLTQVELAELTGIRQADISEMENSEVIDNEETLERLVRELGTTVDAIRKTKLEDILESRSVQYNDVDVNGATDSKDVVGQGYDVNQTFNYVTPELKAAYQSLLDEKDVRINEYKQANEELRKQLADLLNKLP